MSIQNKATELSTELSKYEFRKLLGEEWKYKSHKVLDFSGQSFKLTTLRGKSGGLLNKYLNLSEIETINLSWNDLVSLEDVFSLDDASKFYSLINLNLMGNKISGFDNPISLPYLIKLNISLNNLSELPDLTCLDNLMYLNLSNNHIQIDSSGKEAWKRLSKCTRLRRLDLSYNNINVSPSTLSRLVLMFKDSLREFSIQGNPFCSVFPEYQSLIISCIPNIKYLNGSKITASQRKKNMNFNFNLINNYDDIYDLRQGSRYDATKILQLGNVNNRNFGRIDILIELFEYLIDEGPSIQLCANILQGSESIYNETMKPWTTEYGGDLGDIDPFEARRFINVFSPSAKLNSDRARETERFLELVAIAIDRQEETPMAQNSDFCRIWLLTALVRLIHIPAGGLAIGVSRLLGNLMNKKDVQSEVSYIISTLVFPALKGRTFSDPIVQTVFASMSILPHSKLLAMALNDHMELILDYTSSYVRTEFHRPLMSILALVSLYKDNAVILSGYGVPMDLAGTLITLYLYSTPANTNKGGFGEMGNQGQSLTVNRPKEESYFRWSSTEHILSDQALDYVSREISASGQLGRGDSFSIHKIAKLLSKKRNKQQTIYKGKQKETLDLNILPDFVKFTDFQQALIIFYLKIIRNCCLASEKASKACIDLGLHSNFLMPILSEFLSSGPTSKFDEKASLLCSEVIQTVNCFVESNKVALMQMIVNFHLIDWLLIPIKETPFGDPDVVFSSMSTLLSICNRSELIESIQYTPISESSSFIGKALNIYNGNLPVGSRFKMFGNGESFQVLNYIIQQMDFLNPQLEFLNGNQYFREMVSFYSSNTESSSYSSEGALEILKNANSEKVQKSIQAILDMIVFLFRNKTIGICSKVIEEIYRKGYCILFMRLLEIPGESVPISAINILSMIDLTEMDTISINELLRLLKIESLSKDGTNKAGGEDELLLSERKDISSSDSDLTFSILGPLWTHILNYIRRLINNKGSSNWYVFKETFAKDIGLIIFSGLKYSWNQFILNSPFKLVVNHLSNANEVQIHDIFVILSSSRVVRALSRYDGFREYLRSPEIKTLFEYSLKKEEKHFAAFDPDTALEISWSGRSVDLLLGTLRGQNRLSSSKKVAVRVLCRLADVLTGVSDAELFELEKSQLDYALQFQKETDLPLEGISTLENSFMNIISRESSMWDLTLEPFIEQLLFLDEMEFSDKLIQDEVFVDEDGIVRVFLFLSNLIDGEFKDIKESSSNTKDFDHKKSIITTANTWAGILKGSILIKEKRVSEKVEENVEDDNNEDLENKGWRGIFNFHGNRISEDGLEDDEFGDGGSLPLLSGSEDQGSLLSLSDSDAEIEEIADLDYEANPNEETSIIHPRARNILHGIYNKYGPLTTGSVENDLKVSNSIVFDNIGGSGSTNSISLTSASLSSSESLKAQNKLEGTGRVWKNIISATVNTHLAVAAFLRIIFVSIKSNTSLKLRSYAKKVMMRPYILDGTAKLVLSCGLLESHVASKFLLILSEIFELDTNTDAASMDMLIPLYIGFWFINSILDGVVYILQQATRRYLKPEEQLLCTSLCRAIYSMLDSLGNIQFSKVEAINEYGLEKSIRYFVTPLLLNCLQQMVLFDIQVSIGSSHGTYMAHIPLMFSRKYIHEKKEEMPETIIKLRESMRQYSSKSLSLLMENSSKYRYYVVEGFTFQAIFRHFPLRRSFIFELMDHVNTMHFSKGVELFLSYYYERNERVIGVYPCYVFIQTKELRDYVKKESSNKGDNDCSSHKKDHGISAGITEFTGIDLSGFLGGGESSSNEDPGPPPSIRSVLILTTNAYYIFERPKTVRNVAITEQFTYKEDPTAIIKREYSDLRRIVKSFLGEQSAMLGWNSMSNHESQSGKRLEAVDDTTNCGFTWRNTIYDIIIFDKIEDRDEMLSRIRKKSAEFLSIPLNIYNDFVSRSCLSHLLRIDNVRAIQFALGEKLKPGEIDHPKIDQLYSLRHTDVKKKKFIIDEMLDMVSDIIFPPNRKSRFPISAYPRAAILHDAEKAQLKLYVVTINSVYEFLVDWRFWFCPDSNMLETDEDLYFRREMVIPPSVEISSLKEINDASGAQKHGLMNFLGILDKIPAQSAIGPQINDNTVQSSENELNDKNPENKSWNVTETNKEQAVNSKSIGISIKNFRSEFTTWYEARLKLAKENLFQKLRVFRIHRLRIAQFGPLEEPELKLVYQLCPRKKKNKKKSKKQRNNLTKKDSDADAKAKHLKPTSSDEDPLLESDESDGDISDSKDATSKEKKKLSRLTSLQLIFLDDSARERFKVGIALVVNELENSNDWKRRMVPVLNPPSLNKIKQKNYKTNKSAFSSFL